MKPAHLPWLLAALIVAPFAGAADMPVYQVTLKDGRIHPAELRVPAHTRFKIVIRNAGHDAVEYESLELRKEKVLAPGAQSFLVFAPLKPGRYRVFDEFHPDSGRAVIIAQ